MRIAHRNITGTFSGGVSQQDLLYVLQLEAGVVPGIHAGGCLRPAHKVPGPGEDGLGLRPTKPVLCTVYTGLYMCTNLSRLSLAPSTATQAMFSLPMSSAGSDKPEQNPFYCSDEMNICFRILPTSCFQ